MKFVYSLFILGACINTVSAQTCPGCIIDETYTVPGLYPAELPPAVAGEYYDADLTFVLQEDTTVDVLGSDVTFAFLNYHILEPIGLPYGIHVTSNLGDFPVDYNPSDGLYGCAKVCGIPLIPGIYTITVPLVATLEDPAGDQPAEYELTLEVLPPTSTSGGIIASTTFGCGPLTVDLSSGHPSDGLGGFSYFWDFGDGTTSTSETPSPVVYTADGTEPVEYIITHIVTVDTVGYNLEYVSVLSTGCDDCTIFGCTGLTTAEYPDLYLNIPGLGITTDAFDDTNPPVTFVLGAELDPGASYTMQVKDDDTGGFGSDDNCGSLTFNGDDVGIFTFDIGSSDIEMSITHPVFTFTYTDTIIVYPVPAVPVLTVSGALEFCEDDSVLLSTTDDPSLTYQWLRDGDPIPSAFDANYTAFESGTYSLQATATGGCTALSDAIPVEMYAYPLPPFVSIIGNTLVTTSEYPIQWYYDGDPIPGANDTSYTPAIEGIYQAAATNGPCTSFSININFVFQGLAASDIFQLSIAPNPFENYTNIKGSFKLGTNIILELKDLQGRLIFSDVLIGSSDMSYQLQTGDLPSGIYILTIRQEEWFGNARLIKN